MANTVKIHNIMYMHKMAPLPTKNPTPNSNVPVPQPISIPSNTIGEVVIQNTAETTTVGTIPLTDATFIIPVRIDSEDRRINFNIVYNYLRTTFKTNIIVYECDKSSVLKDVVREDVTYIFEQNDSECFHRTRYLNYMLNLVRTKVTVNYDLDVMFQPETYTACHDKIVEGYDLIYPYQYGNYLHQISYSGRDKLSNGISLNELTDGDYVEKSCGSKYGHCQFFNTDSYKAYGWENENFISWGPEDIERFHRFNKLSKVKHLTGSYVYHIEHLRSNNSSSSNPYFNHNTNLWKSLDKMTNEQLIEYYKTVDYIRKYNL